MPKGKPKKKAVKKAKEVVPEVTVEEKVIETPPNPEVIQVDPVCDVPVRNDQLNDGVVN